MLDISTELLHRHLKAVQISYSMSHIRFVLVSLLILNFYIFCTYHYNFSQHSFYLNFWFFTSEFLLSLFWLISTVYFNPQSYSVKLVHRWISGVCLSIGCMVAAGVVCIYYYLPSISEQFSFIDALVLSALLVIVTQTLCLTYLTQRISYFYLVFIPSVLPYLLAQFLCFESSHQVFHLSVNFIVVVILLCANAVHRINRHVSRFSIKNKELKREAEKQVAWTDDLCKQLQKQVQKSKEIEQQLQLNNQLLEQKVRERTFDIQAINKDLENQQNNLSLAHKVAGMRPWDWNIKARVISLTNDKQEKIVKNSTEHNKHLHYLIHPEDMKLFKAALRRHLRGHSDRYEATYRIQHRDGKWYWVHDTGYVISRDPKTQRPLQMVGIRRDIQHEKTNQERLRLSASVLEQAEQGIFILDDQLRYIDVNPFYERLTGLKSAEMNGQHLFDVVSNQNSNQRILHNKIIAQLLEKGEFDGELEEHFLSGKELCVWMHLNAITDDQDRITHYLGIVSDLTERKMQEQRLSYLENYDTLTDLPNRFYYNYQLHQYLVSQKQHTHRLAIIRVNIDRFRPLNEFLSNLGGDEILRQVAQRLRSTNPEALVVAHLNGDDFAIVYEISETQPAIQVHIDHIHKAFSLPFDIFGQEHIITLSMGVSQYPEHGRQLDYLNNCAEQALMEAKRLGGHTTKFYTLGNTPALEQAIYLERDLRLAIQNNELMVYYQPKINFHDQKIYGFEALVRWNHPTKGIVAPGLFIPLAEKTSLISDLGRIVILQTAKQIQEWAKLGFDNICVSVNIVAQQLERGQLLKDLDDALDVYQISGQNLELEITESTLIENSSHIRDLLEKIKLRGIHISLDDFGTGYSSLAYLSDLPIDTLKIDRTFISKIGQRKQEAIVSAIIAMGKALGMTVVAEGIETEQQLSYLQNLKCDIAQGYLFSKPLPQLDATQYLKDHFDALPHFS